jgi:hypothetical protein
MAQEEAAATGPNTGAVSLSLGLDFTTAYFYRGIIQQTNGIIYQPSADVTFQLTDALSVYVGTWNSMHTNTGGAADQWYESDFFVGASYALSECLTFDASYIWLYGPSIGAEFAQEVDLSLSYDDSALWGDSFNGLQPHVLVAIETSGGSDGYGLTDSNGVPASRDLGIYYEIGIAPSFTLVDSASSPVTLTIPVTVGFGSNYYEITREFVNAGPDGILGGAGAADDFNDNTTDDEAFGFVDIGLDFSMPLSFVPAQFGSWEASTGVHFLFLGDNAKAGNGGDDLEIIGTFGISMSY